VTDIPSVTLDVAILLGSPTLLPVNKGFLAWHGAGAAPKSGRIFTTIRRARPRLLMRRGSQQKSRGSGQGFQVF